MEEKIKTALEIAKEVLTVVPYTTQAEITHTLAEAVVKLTEDNEATQRLLIAGQGKTFAAMCKMNEELAEEITELKNDFASLDKAMENTKEINMAHRKDLFHAEEVLEKTQAILALIQSMCGAPDAADGCRNIIKICDEWLSRYGVKEL